MWDLWSDDQAAAFWSPGIALWFVPLYRDGLDGPVCYAMPAVGASKQEAIAHARVEVARNPGWHNQVGNVAVHACIETNPYPPSVADLAAVFACGPRGRVKYDLRPYYVGPMNSRDWWDGSVWTKRPYDGTWVGEQV